MDQPKPIVLVRASELAAVADFPSVADADKAAAQFGLGDYLVVRIIHPVTVGAPPPSNLVTNVGRGYIRKTKRKPAAAGTPDSSQAPE